MICTEVRLLLIDKMRMQTFGGDNFLMQNTAQHKYVWFILTGDILQQDLQ